MKIQISFLCGKILDLYLMKKINQFLYAERNFKSVFNQNIDLFLY